VRGKASCNHPSQRANRRLDGKLCEDFPAGTTAQNNGTLNKEIKTHQAHRSRQSQQAKTRLARPGFLPSSPPPQNRKHLADGLSSQESWLMTGVWWGNFRGEAALLPRQKSMTGNCRVRSLLLYSRILCWGTLEQAARISIPTSL
jgi:hypothetical protein